MFKALTPIIALIIAIGLFFTYVRPTFDEIKAVQAETREYQEAIDKAEQLRARVDTLTQERNNIALSDLERLEALLPDAIDEVQLLIDLDTLAGANNLDFNNISVEDSVVTEGSGRGQAPSAGTDGSGGVESAAAQSVNPHDLYTGLDISFTVTGGYRDFRAFIGALEEMLVIAEIVELDFTTPTEVTDEISYNVTVRVFELNPL